MAARRPLHSTAMPSEDFSLNYDTETLTLKSQTENRFPALAQTSASNRQPGISWDQTPELVIKVSGLPLDVSVLRLSTILEKEGTVQDIQIDRDPDLLIEALFAIIIFSPPPDRFNLRKCRSDLSHYFKPKSGTAVHAVDVTVINAPPLRTENPICHDRSSYRRIVIQAESVDFGFVYDVDEVRIMYSTPSSEQHPSLLVLDTQRHELSIQFAENATSEGYSVYKLRVPLQHVEQILRQGSVDDDKTFDLIISLATPPILHKLRVDSGQPQRLSGDGEFRTAQWQRVTKIDNTAPSMPGAVSPSLRDSTINIGAWTTYKIQLLPSKQRPGLLSEFSGALRDHNVTILQAPSGFRVSRAKPATCRDLLRVNDLEHHDDTTVLPWNVHYQLEVCISQGLLSEYRICRDFINILATMKVDKATQLLEHVADLNKRIYRPMSIFKLDPPGTVSCTPTPRHCVLLRQALITPSTIYFASPTVEMTNRVLRQFSQHADRFLRVRFSDEKVEGRLWSSANDSCDPLYERVRQCLLHGISIGGRHYEYLASGNSQFREHGAYFFSSTTTLRAADIRFWLGDLRDIKVISKYMSRMGQGFSTTRAIQSTRVVIKEDQDITHNGYTFTDGVGKISRFLAQSIAIELGFPNPSDPPSVFQFRLGGCKGVLALWPDTAKAREIHIRPSQYKFSAVHEGLEIIRCSSFASADLNRQLITCLTTLGVPDEVFLGMLRKQLADLNEAMGSEEKAIQMLNRRVDANQMRLQLAHLIRSRFLTSKEPFVTSLMYLWRVWSLTKLKEKARISIDQSAFVLGCTDESKMLKGYTNCDAQMPLLLGSQEECIEALPQIFLRISSHEQPNTYKTITGPCIVARNPSLHPGDIRVVNAVDNQRLCHLKDVVVFPQTGDRDIPSMCSGGDLDGDDFMVSWDPDLLPPMHMWNVQPMDFTSPSPIVKQNITMEDCADFFVNHMKHDNLGKIANAWQAISDASPAKAADLRCNQLASLHSTAVDFPKTGVPAVLPPELQPKQYPHFMPSKFRPKSKIYHSDTVLGRIYDEVQGIEYNPVVSGKKFDLRILACTFRGNPCHSSISQLNEENPKQSMQAKALSLKQQYDVSLRRIMTQHEINTEFEVWTGFVLSHNQASGDYKFHETIGELASSLKERFRSACVDAAHEILSGSEMATSSGDTVAGMPHNMAKSEPKSQFVSMKQPNQINAKRDTYEAMAPFVQAMYAATQHEVECYESLEPYEKATNTPPLISFPWLFPDYLGRMAIENSIPEPRTSTLIESFQDLDSHADCTLLEDPFSCRIPTEPKAMRVGSGLSASKHALSPQAASPDKKRVKLDAEGLEYPTSNTQELLIDLTPDIPEASRNDEILIDLSDHGTTDDESQDVSMTTSHEELLELLFNSPLLIRSNTNPNEDFRPYTPTRTSDDEHSRSPPTTGLYTPPPSVTPPDLSPPHPPPPPPSSPATPATSTKPKQTITSTGSPIARKSDRMIESNEAEIDNLSTLFSRKLSLSLSPSLSLSSSAREDGTDKGDAHKGDDSTSGSATDEDDGAYRRSYECRPRYDEEAFVLGYDEDDEVFGSGTGVSGKAGGMGMVVGGGVAHGVSTGVDEFGGMDGMEEESDNESEQQEKADGEQEEKGDDELSPLEKLGKLVGM